MSKTKQNVFDINMLRKYLGRPDFLKQLLNHDIPEDPQKANSLIILPEEDGPEAAIPNSIEFSETNQKLNLQT